MNGSVGQPNLKAELAGRAISLGFDLCRIAPAIEAPHAADFRDWLAKGAQGSMQ